MGIASSDGNKISGITSSKREKSIFFISIQKHVLYLLNLIGEEVNGKSKRHIKIYYNCIGAIEIQPDVKMQTS